MVAAWGGYVFVINLIGVHAGILVLLGRFSTKLYRAYTAFYVVGTFLAMQVPVVGLAPLKSLEQLGPCAVFLGFQVLQFIAYQSRKNKLSRVDTVKLALKVIGLALVALLAFVFFLQHKGYFGPISSRVRGLFVKHTKTGNPLVDSVAEHQPAQSSAYKQYLDNSAVVAPIGFMLVAFRYFNDSSSFLLVYGLATYFFSLKMVRLILLTAPIASVLAGVVIGRVIGLIIYNILGFSPSLMDITLVDGDADDETTPEEKKTVQSTNSKKKGKAETNGTNGKSDETNKPTATGNAFALGRAFICKIGIIALAFYGYKMFAPEAKEFYERSHAISKHLSNPTIVQKGQLKSGQTVLVDDYRDW